MKANEEDRNMSVVLDGKEVKIGDKMWSFITGWGVVEEISDFISISSKSGLHSFYRAGSFHQDTPRCLFWDEVVVEPPKPKVPVEKWKWVLVIHDGGHTCESVTGTYFSEKGIIEACRHQTTEVVGRIQETKIVVEE